MSIQFVVGVQQDVTDLKTYLEEKASGLGRWGYQLQPHVVFLAEGDDDLTSRCVAYACVHSTVFYEAASVMEAVDVAFKSMFVLGLQYPAPAHSSWAFVQKAVYGLSHRFDRIPSKVFELLTDIRKWESEH